MLRLGPRNLKLQQKIPIYGKMLAILASTNAYYTHSMGKRFKGRLNPPLFARINSKCCCKTIRFEWPDENINPATNRHKYIKMTCNFDGTFTTTNSTCRINSRSNRRALKQQDDGENGRHLP